jgi:hypothetical protein
MPVTINGNGSITGLSVGGLGSGVVNSTTLADGAATGSKLGTGSIIKVLQTVKTDTFSRNGSSWGDITGMNQSITPISTSSKVFVMVDLKIGADHGDSDYNFKIVRGSTDIYIGDADGNKRRSSMGTGSYGMPSNTADGQYRLEQVSLMFLDSPSTTSATTYKVQIINVGGRTNYINRNHHNGDTNATPRTASSITLMEIAG